MPMGIKGESPLIGRFALPQLIRHCKLLDSMPYLVDLSPGNSGSGCPFRNTNAVRGLRWWL
jgi:hypothetical protein